ncbi:uroporphyrinogen-III C-methyltransferase [archaeon]|nr:uroporphyrinogen-III C-methyltransferase [archaeon]
MKKIYLVGAGPGDPELITVKGLDLIKKADVIIYDRLASEDLLKNAKEDAKLVYVGKRTGDHKFTQPEINEILVKEAADDKVVVRLKGGDPFVFGRGGEEITKLIEHGIAFEVVPGVTSAISVPALAGIPVTDRRYSSSFTIVTGQEDPTKEEERLDYGNLNADTVIVLMGVGNLSKISKQMLRTRDANTPVAIIESGASDKQRVVTGTLGNLAELAEKENIKPPAITVIGDVVKLKFNK